MSVHQRFILVASVLCTTFGPGCEKQERIPQDDLITQIGKTGAAATFNNQVLILSFAPEDWNPAKLAEINT